MLRRLLIIALIAFTATGPLSVRAADRAMACRDAAEHMDSDCCPEALGDDCELACSLRCTAAVTAPAIGSAAQPIIKTQIADGFVGQGAPEWSMAPPTPPPNSIQQVR